MDPTAADPAGPTATPRWYRPALLVLLLVVGVAYLWGLGASKWANSFYSAAAQAGATSWKAWFFGSFDASNAITVDKPPASLWVMGLSARLFGVGAWSILVPQALMGVGSVALVVATVKRWFRPGAALLAGAVFAATPVAALMFRFNNPDALLVLLLCGAAYAVTRAIGTDGGSWRWLALAGTLVGFAFLSKMLQAFAVGPAFAAAYLIAAPTDLRRRIRDLAVLAATTFLGASWWIAAVELWPASSRPYIGGSQHNSVLELVFGYNGFGRLTGNETGSVRGQAAVNAAGRWGPTGWLRMFNPAFGGQISWLLPAALVMLVAGLVWTARTPRTDRSRAALVIWGGWLVVTGVLFSLGKGIIHEYYTVALAPAIGALVGIGASLAWDRRDRPAARAVMVGSLAVTVIWSMVLLSRTDDWNRWLAPVVVVVGVVSAVLLALGDRHRRGALTAGALGAGLAVVAGLAVPVAATVTTVRTPHSGAIPTAGPSMRPAGPSVGLPRWLPWNANGAFRTRSGGSVGAASGLPGVSPPGVPGPPMPPPGGLPPGGFPGGPPGGPAVGSPTGAGTATRPGRGMAGLLRSRTPRKATIRALRADARDFDWVLATVGSNNAAGYQLAAREPVMAIGGFNGTDPYPTLAQFRRLVAGRRIHYFAPGLEGGFSMGGSDVGSAITSWVRSNFTAVDAGGFTLFDLTAPLDGTSGGSSGAGYGGGAGG